QSQYGLMAGLSNAKSLRWAWTRPILRAHASAPRPGRMTRRRRSCPRGSKKASPTAVAAAQGERTSCCSAPPFPGWLSRTVLSTRSSGPDGDLAGSGTDLDVVAALKLVVVGASPVDPSAAVDLVDGQLGG